MDFTKDRLSALQAELNGLEIEINKETQKSYAHLTVEEVEKYLLTKVFEDTNDIKTRKLLVNTFIREIIWYENKLVITYNFHENVIPERPTKSHIEDIEMQIKEASRSAFSFSHGFAQIPTLGRIRTHHGRALLRPRKVPEASNASRGHFWG